MTKMIELKLFDFVRSECVRVARLTKEFFDWFIFRFAISKTSNTFSVYNIYISFCRHNSLNLFYFHFSQFLLAFFFCENAKRSDSFSFSAFICQFYFWFLCWMLTVFMVFFVSIQYAAACFYCREYIVLRRWCMHTYTLQTLNFVLLPYAQHTKQNPNRCTWRVEIIRKRLILLHFFQSFFSTFFF